MSREIIKPLFFLLGFAAVACGSITAADPSPTGGAGGQLAAGGRGGELGTGGAAGQAAGGAGGASSSCLEPAPDGGLQGFAYNAPCDASVTVNGSGLTAWLDACRAACSLNGAQWVGCQIDTRATSGVVVCRASCAACP